MASGFKISDFRSPKIDSLAKMIILRKQFKIDK